MATGQGTVTFDFGTGKGSTRAAVTGVNATGMSATSNLEIYIGGTDTTSTHNAAEHRLIGSLNFGAYPTAKSAGSFDAEAISTLQLTGTIACRFVWAD
jgi:hypothetical protein